MEGKSGGDGELDDLVEEDCRACEVSMVPSGLHYPTVMHDLHEETCLAKECVRGTLLPVAFRLAGRRGATHENEG